MVKVDPRAKWAFAGALAALTGCGSPSAPAPSKVSEQKPLLQRPARAPERTGPFRNPKLDTPQGREGTQLATAELSDVLKQARQALADGNDNEAIRLLRKCANKLQPSGVCEGELALVLLPLPAFKADANYYLDQACGLDDPEMDAAFYVKLGEAANKRGRLPSAAKAYKLAMARGRDDADIWTRYSGVLQSDPERLADAEDALRVALEKDPKQHDLMLERATLLGQLQKHKQAAELLQQYLAKSSAIKPKKRNQLESRIQTLLAKAESPDRGGEQ